MKGDVICVIEQILHKLSMEDEQLEQNFKTFNNADKNVCSKKNLSFSKVDEDASLITCSEKEKKLIYNLNTSNSLNKNENSINTDTSSGFGDSNTLKTSNNDSLKKAESITYFQIQNKIVDIRDPEVNDFNRNNIDKASTIFTSTPKKNKRESKDISLENSINSTENSLEGNLFFECNEKTECLNKTIEEAITKYEKEIVAKKMEDAAVQTSFEKSTSNYHCGIYMSKETNKFLPRNNAEEPPPKKAKIEIDSKISDNLIKNLDQKFESPPLDKESKIDSSIETPIPNLPVKENNEINKNEEKNNFCKIPRIRVGLSRRAKIRPQT